MCQEVGHTGRGCLKSRQARKSAENKNDNNKNNNNTTRDDNNINNLSVDTSLKVKSDGNTRVVTTTKPSSKSEEDLRIKLNNKRVAKTTPKNQVEIPVQKSLPPQKEIAAGELQNQQTEGGSNDIEPQTEATSSVSSVDKMEIEPFESPPNRRSSNAKYQRYTRWDGRQAVILSPTVTAPSSPEPNGPAPATISTSPPAAHLAALRQMFHLPLKSEQSETGDIPSSSVEDQLKVLTRQSQTSGSQAPSLIH